MKLHLPKMLFAAVMACFGMVQAATLSSISEKLPITINLNFASGKGAAPNSDTTKITVAGVTTTGSQWINLTGASGTDVAVTDTAGKTYKLTFSSPNVWQNDGTADALNINKGYLDMSNNAQGRGISITLTNEDGTAIEWSQVNILMTGDGGQYGGVNVNGTNYYYVGTTLTQGSAAWGTRTGAATYTEGTNLMVLKPGSVASADGLTLTTAANTNRATMGGLQVVTGYGESQVTGYKISDFSEGETASLAALVTTQDLTALPLTIEVTATAAADDVAGLTIDRAIGEMIVKGGALGMDITSDVTVGTIATEDGGSIGSLSIAAGKTLTVTGPMAGVTATTSGTGKLVIVMENKKEASGKSILNFGDDCKFESVRISGGVIATNLNSTARSSNIGSADLVMAGGTTYVIRNGNGTGGSITTGDILLEGAMDLMVYGSTHDSVISNDIKEASEDADTYIRKTDGGTTTLTGEVTVDSVRVAAGTLVLGEGNVTTTGQIRLSENGSNGNKLVINGATLKVTGTTNAHSTGDSIVLAHWGQTGFLEVNAGTLDATGAVALLSWTGTGTMNLNGGTTKLLGVNFWGQQGLKGTINLGSATEGDAVLELGGTGFHEFGAGATVNLGNGTIKLAEDSVIDYNADGNAGSLNLVGTNGGTKFDTNGHTFTIGVRHNSHTTAANINLTGGGDMTKIGAGTLVVNGNVEAGLITVEEGTLKLNGTTFISQTIVNNGTLATDGGSLAITSTEGLDGEAVYSDKLDTASGNGYLSDALLTIIKADEGKTSTLEGLTKVSIGGQEYDLDITETGATVAISQGEDAGGVYFVNKGTVDYGAATNSAASDATTGIALTGGDLRVSTSLKDGVTIAVVQDATLDIADGVSVSKDQVTGDGAITLAGAGAFGIGAAVAMPTGVTLGSDWTGTIVVDGFSFAGDDGKLANLANSNSYVGLTNCTGWLTPGGTVSGNLNLLKGEALSLTDGSSGRTQTFSGKIKGEGDFLINMVGKACNDITYVFSGDVSKWTGSFKTLAPSAKTFGLQFTGKGDIGASVTNTNGITLNMVVGGSGNRAMNGAITNDGGTLNLTVRGGGMKSFNGGVTVTKMTVDAGTGVTLAGTSSIGTLEANGTITNKGAMSVVTGLGTPADTAVFDIAADKSTLVQSDGTTPSTDGNGFMTGGYYYVVKNVDGGSLNIDTTAVTGKYKLDGGNLLYEAEGGDDTTYYINNSIAFTGSDAANVGAGKTIQVMSDAVLSLEKTGVAADVTLATTRSGTVLLIGEGDWNCETTLGADKKRIGNLKADAGVNPVVSFATAEAFKNAGTNITLADNSLLKVSVAAGQTKGMAAFNNVKGGTIVIDPNSGTGNLSLDPGNACTYSGSIEFVLSQFVIVDTNNGKQMFQADANGKYADITVTAKTSGKALIINPNYWNKSQAWNIGCLSGNGEINGKNKDNPADHLGRYIAVHQDKDTTFSGLFVDSGVSGGKPNRSVGILKYGEGTLTLTGANGSLADLDIHEGTIALKGAGAWAGDVMVADGATLDMSEAATKSLTKLTVHGGATLNAGGEAIALGSLALEGVGGGKLLTLEGLDYSGKYSYNLFTGLTADGAITGLDFEVEMGQTVAVANKYISGVGEEARLLLSGGTVTLVSKLSTDFYWMGGDTTWDDADTDWARDEDATAADAVYVDAVTAHFSGVTSGITVSGDRSAKGLVVSDSSALTLTAGEGNSLSIGPDGLEINKSGLTLSGAIDMAEGAVASFTDASSLTLSDDTTITTGALEITGTVISHTGDTTDAFDVTAGDVFTVTGGSVTSKATGDNTMAAKLSGVALTQAGAGTLTLSGGNTLASLTAESGEVAVTGTTTIGGAELSAGAVVTTGASGFDLAAEDSTVTGGSLTTDATGINAKLSGVALTTTADTSISGAQKLASLTTGSTAATLENTTIGGTTLSGTTVTTGTEAFDLGSATTKVTGGTVTTDAATINATLTGVGLTTAGAASFNGTQSLSGLTVGGTATINGTVAAATVNGTVTLAGAGDLSTVGDLSLAGANSIGSLTANSLALGDGATLSATKLTLKSNAVAVAGLTGISSTNHLLDVTGDVSPSGLEFGIDVAKLGQASFNDQHELVLATVKGLANASFEGGETSLTDDQRKRVYSISVEEGAVKVVFSSNTTGWTSSDGDWETGKDGEFAKDVTATTDTGFTGHGNAQVNVVGDKTVGSLTVELDGNSTVDEYTISGDGITTGSLNVNSGSLVIENAITADTTDVLADGKLTIGEDGVLTAGKATGAITNNGDLSIADGSSVTLAGDGDLTTSGDTTVALDTGASIGTLTNAGNLILTTDTTIGTLENTGDVDATGKTLTLTKETGNGGSVAADKLVLAGEDNTFSFVFADQVTGNAGGLLTFDGATAADQSSINSIDNGGSIEAKGEAVVYLNQDSLTVEDLHVRDNAMVNAGAVTVEGVLAGDGELNADSLTLESSGSTIGKLGTEKITMSADMLDQDTPILTVNSLSAASVEVELTDLSAASVASQATGEYVLIATGDADKVTTVGAGVSTITNDVAEQTTKYARIGATDTGVALVVADDSDRTWHTDEAYTYFMDDGTTKVLAVEASLGNNNKAYRSLDTVQNVVVDGGDTAIDLGSANQAGMGADGLIVRNLTGDADSTLTLAGRESDKVTLLNTKDTQGGETLDIQNLQVQVKSDNGSKLTIGKLNGNGTIGGELSISGEGGKFSGEYNDATISMAGGSQTLAAGSGLTVTGASGEATLTVADGASITAIQTTGADVALGDGAAVAPALKLEGASSMEGGKLSLAVSALDVRSAINGGEVYTATTDGTLSLSGVEVEVNLTDTETVGTLSTSVSGDQIVLFCINDVEGSVVDDCTLTLENGEILKKYFSNIRLVQGSIKVVGDRQTKYYLEKFHGGTTANGNLGLTMASGALSYLDPQNNRNAYGDLASVLDTLDRTTSKDVADKVGAALAGASISVLGTAQSADVDRQLRAIRNRVVNMGSVSECFDLHDQPRYHMWVNAETDYNKLSEDGTAPGYTLSSWGGTVGFDYDFSSRFTAGLALTAMYGKLTVSGPEDSASGNLDNYYVSLFARYATKSWVNMFVLTVGTADASLDRTVGSYSTSGSTSGVSFGALYELAYTIPVGEDGNACWQPVFNIALKHTTLSAYDEDGGSGAVSAGSQDMTSVTFGLGARAQMVIGETTYNRSSVLELRALAKFETGDRGASTNVSLPALRGYQGSVKSAERGGFGVEVGAGLVVPVGVESGTLFFDASAELRGGSTGFNGTAGYRITF